MYKILAKVYDLMGVIVFPTKKINPRLALANKISNQDLYILDVCCGTANTSIAIAQKNARHKILGIDLSEDMLKVAGNKILRKKLSNIELIEMDATNIDFKEQFDVITTSLSLHEMPKNIMDSVICQMASKLKPDGKLYIIDWCKPNNLLSKSLFMIFPYLFEPRGFGHFIKINWNSYLSKYGLKVDNIEKYSFTTLMTISK